MKDCLFIDIIKMNVFIDYPWSTVHFLSTVHFILGVKSWSSVTIGETPKPVVGHKSPYFQDEFPSLASTGDEKGKEGDKKDTDVKEQYGPGPSLRPQSKDLRSFISPTYNLND